MSENRMPHKGHEHHLCYLQNIGYIRSQLEDFKALVEDSRFVCTHCGRAAASEVSLCQPEETTCTPKLWVL